MQSRIRGALAALLAWTMAGCGQVHAPEVSAGSAGGGGGAGGAPPGKPCSTVTDRACDGDVVVRAGDGAALLSCAEQTPPMKCVEPGFCAEAADTEPASMPAVPLGAPLSVAQIGGADDGGAILVAWAGKNDVHVGKMPADGSSFEPVFHAPDQPFISQMTMSVGGPKEARRAFVAWTAGGGLIVAVLNAGGGVVAPPTSVAEAWSLERVSVAGTLEGAVVTYIHADGNAVSNEPGPFPHVARLDLNGAVVADAPLDPSIWKSFDATMTATPDGHHAAAYVEYLDPSGSEHEQAIRLVRFKPDGTPIDAAPAVILPTPLGTYLGPGGGHVPLTPVLVPGVDPSLLLRVPDSHGGPRAWRFARASITDPSDVVLGPFQADVSPCVPYEEDFALLGFEGRAVAAVVAQAVERTDDPHHLVERSELRAQIVDVTHDPVALLGPLPLAVWDPSPGVEGPQTPGPLRVVATPGAPGQLMVLWRDSLLHRRSFRIAPPSED
jgi:hypothetical protein